MRREGGTTDGTTDLAQLPGLLAIVKTAQIMVAMTIECPGCEMAIKLSHLSATIDDDGLAHVDGDEVDRALSVHLALSCDG